MRRAKIWEDLTGGDVNNKTLGWGQQNKRNACVEKPETKKTETAMIPDSQRLDYQGLQTSVVSMRLDQRIFLTNLPSGMVVEYVSNICMYGGPRFKSRFCCFLLPAWML